MGMHVGQCGKQRAEVQLHVRDRERAEVFAEVNVLEVGEYGDDLVSVAEGGDEWDDRGVPSKVMEERELVLDARGRGGDVDFLDSDEFGFADGAGGVGAVVPTGGGGG